MKDVFLSWTGKDKTLKDQIRESLEAKGITCIDSERDCQGNYETWSVRTVSECTIFLVILTEHSLKSEYMPSEIKEALRLEDASDRIIPVCTDSAYYEDAIFGEAEENTLKGRKISYIKVDREISEKSKEEICTKTIALINQHAYATYRKNMLSNSWS